MLRPLLRAAAACGIRALRNPFGPRRPWRSSQLLARPGLWTRYAELRFLRHFAARFREAVEREAFVTPDGTLGIEVTGVLDETLFQAIAEDMPEGTWEFVCHPGYNDAELQPPRPGCASRARLNCALSLCPRLVKSFAATELH